MTKTVPDPYRVGHSLRPSRRPFTAEDAVRLFEQWLTVTISRPPGGRDDRVVILGPGWPSESRDHGGIFSGMISHPDPDAVVSELGDKVVDAIVHAVAEAKDQFAKYRRDNAGWAANNAPRTLACMIHDWMWADLKEQLEQVTHVSLVDNQPTREIGVRVESEDRMSYLLRIKLHHLDGRTSSYQTQTVIDYELQGDTQTFPGWDQTRLEAGYEWDKDTRTIGAPVISLRDGRNNIIWVHQLPQQGQTGIGTVVRPTQPQPTLPDVDVHVDADEDTGTERT